MSLIQKLCSIFDVFGVKIEDKKEESKKEDLPSSNIEHGSGSVWLFRGTIASGAVTSFSGSLISGAMFIPSSGVLMYGPIISGRDDRSK